MENRVRPKPRPYQTEGWEIGWEFVRQAKVYARTTDEGTEIWIPLYPSGFRRKEWQFVRVRDRDDAKAYIYMRYDDPAQARFCWECYSFANTYEMERRF